MKRVFSDLKKRLQTCNFIEKETLAQHRCFPVNFAKFVITFFLQNNSGGCFWKTFSFYLKRLLFLRLRRFDSLEFENSKKTFWAEHLLMADSDFFYILVEYLQRQFKYLKDNLKKCLDRRANIMTKSGAAATSLPTCNYFNQMLYLVEGVGISQLKAISRKRLENPRHRHQLNTKMLMKRVC